MLSPQAPALPCLYVCAPHECLVPAEARSGHWILVMEVTDGYELQCGWELNLRLLEEQLVLLTAEPSLQPFPRF